jgi:hypothetical protein
MSRILPVFQFSLAVVLLKWGEYHPHPTWFIPGLHGVFWLPTSNLVCYGINAPAYRFVPILNALFFDNRFVRPIAGFYPQDLLLLVGVVVLWYLVGREIDARRCPQESSLASSPTGKIVRNLLVALCGVILLATINLHDTDNNTTGDLIARILWFIWALVLIFLPAQKFFDMLRRKDMNSGTSRA